MPDEFLNPYHFVPVKKPSAKDVLRKDPAPTAEEFRKKGASGRLSHAAYAPDTLSGRILVKLTTETPLVVGGEQDKDGKGDKDYTIVEPYRFKGEPAIPATSLRGMLSSIVEAASQSAMRVFHDKKPVSYRQPMDRALSAIGRIEKRRDGTFGLLPLCAPHIEIVHRDDEERERKTVHTPAFDDRGDYYYFAHHRHPDQQAWRDIFADEVALKTYVGTYHEQVYITTSNCRIAKRNNSGYPVTKFNGSQIAFWKTVLVDNVVFDPTTALARPFHYMKVRPSESLAALVATHAADGKRMKKGRTVIIGRRAEDECVQKKNVEYSRNLTGTVRSAGNGEFKRGLIRILGVQDRDMAVTKKHEIFIPFPEKLDEEEERNRRLLPITEEAIATFEALAREVAEAVKGDTKKPKDETESAEVEAKKLRIARPYLPLGTREAMRADRKERDKDGVWEPRLREGQLVYFDIEAGEEGEPVVSAISFSSIWRGLVEKAPKGDEPDAHIASLGDFFRTIDKELLPFDSKRETISPAEWLFGFVSADGKPNRQNPHVAYAGRVRVSTGRLETAAGDDAKEKIFLPGEQEPKPGEGLPREDADRVNGMVRLKTLGSPKPPSPQLYFYDNVRPTEAIAKHMLEPGKHLPQGRKFYLHHEGNGEPWATKLELGTDDEKKQAKLKNAVKPIKDGATFWFHIDFDNLSEAELGLLCFALEPSETFRHKLGMGKGMGLGTVHLEPQALCLVDRGERYGTTTDLFTANRYSEVVQSANADSTKWPALYQREKNEAGKSCADRATACAAWLRAAYPDALTALLAIGEATLPAHPVHSPLAADQWDCTKREGAELETFKWFANNTEHIRKQTSAKQQLRRLDKTTSALPTLKRNRRPTS